MSVSAFDKGLAISKNDIIIAITGPSGTGKSSFINTAIGKPAMVVGHDLDFCTKEISVISCKHPDGSGRNVIFVDTPGFDEGEAVDDVLRTVADWLAQTYDKKVTLTGILLLHSISQCRTHGTPLKNLEICRQLFGTGALRNLILTTTTWDIVAEDKGSIREGQLRDQFWESMMSHGCRIARFRSTHKSAWGIIDQLDLASCQLDKRKTTKKVSEDTQTADFIDLNSGLKDCVTPESQETCSAKAKLQKAANKLESAKQDILSTVAELQKRADGIESAQQEMSKIKAVLRKAVEELKIAKQEVSVTNMQLHATAESLTSMRSELSTTKADLQKAGNEVKAAKLEISKITVESHRMANELKSTKHQLTTSHAQLEMTNKKLGTAELEVVQTKVEFQKAASELSNAKNEVSDTKNGWQKTANELKSAKHELSITHAQLQRTTSELKYTRQDVSTTEAQLQKMAHELSVSKQETSAAKAELQKAANEIVSTKQEASGAQVQSREAANEPSASKQELSTVEAKLSNKPVLAREEVSTTPGHLQEMAGECKPTGHDVSTSGLELQKKQTELNTSQQEIFTAKGLQKNEINILLQEISAQREPQKAASDDMSTARVASTTEAYLGKIANETQNNSMANDDLPKTVKKVNFAEGEVSGIKTELRKTSDELYSVRQELLTTKAELHKTANELRGSNASLVKTQNQLKQSAAACAAMQVALPPDFGSRVSILAIIWGNQRICDETITNKCKELAHNKKPVKFDSQFFGGLDPMVDQCKVGTVVYRYDHEGPLRYLILKEYEQGYFDLLS